MFIYFQRAVKVDEGGKGGGVSEVSRSCEIMALCLMSGWGQQYLVTERIPLPSLCHWGRARPKSRSYCHAAAQQYHSGDRS